MSDRVLGYLFLFAGCCSASSTALSIAVGDTQSAALWGAGTLWMAWSAADELG